MKRKMTISLDKSDWPRFFEKAAGAGLTPEELIENFINDLICGEHSNGSDERDLAYAWFERCWFSHTSPETFLQYLISYGTLDEFLENLHDYEQADEEIAELENELTGYDFVTVPGREGLWDVGHYRDGTSVYTSKEIIEKQIADEIECVERNASYCKEQIDAFWKAFLKKKPEADYDDELRIIRNWTESTKLTD